MGLEELEAAWNANADRFNQWSELGLDEIVAFAQEVEREACAKVCENEYPHSGYHPTLRKAARQCAAAIRVRSNAELSGATLAERPTRTPG